MTLCQNIFCLLYEDVSPIISIDLSHDTDINVVSTVSSDAENEMKCLMSVQW